LESTSGDCAFKTYELELESNIPLAIPTAELLATSGDCSFATYELDQEDRTIPVYYYGLSEGSDSCVITGTSHAATINVPTYTLASGGATEVLSYVQQTGTTTATVTITCTDEP
jgi:hypothetical protein